MAIVPYCYVSIEAADLFLSTYAVFDTAINGNNVVLVQTDWNNGGCHLHPAWVLEIAESPEKEEDLYNPCGAQTFRASWKEALEKDGESTLPFEGFLCHLPRFV